MKKVLVGVLMVILTLCTLVGCTIKPVTPGGNNDTPKGDLASAKAALNVMYYGAGPVFVGDIERTSVVNVKGNLYPVTWTTDATEGVEIGEVNEETATVVIHLTQSKDHDINFKLIATITDPATGETITAEYNYTIAKWKENTFAEYLAAAAGDPVVVKGIVSGIMSKQLGDSYNGIYFDDGIGGYYAYDCEDPIEKGVEVGMEIRVSGLKDIYSGTHEIKDGVVEILNSEKKELAPVDFTELYANASDLLNEALVKPQALLVTIKGVTIGGQETSNGYYYFSLGGLESYVRISSSMCPLNAADTAAFKEFHSAHLGYTADVTGVICVFSGAFYLTPVSVDAFTNVQLPELDDAGKVALEKENLEVIANITEEGVVELPVIGKTFTDVTIAWASNNEAFQVAADGKLNVVLPEEATTIVLTATITSGSVQETKEFSVLIDAASTQAYVFKPISAPAAGTYKIAMNTTPANGGVLYFDGTLNSKGALQTTDKIEKAVDVVVEVVDGGYTLKVGDKYLEGYLNGTYKNLRLVDNAAVWTWNEEAKVFVCDIAGIKYYFGDRDRGGYANTTMALSDIKYITGDNLSKVGVSQFPGAFGTLAPADYRPVAIEAPQAGTFKIVMNTTPANGGLLYFDGTLNSKGALQTTDKIEKAVDVVVEVVDGGYALKVGDKYLEGYLNGTYKNLRLVDNAAVWTWNEEVKVFVCDIEGIKYYFGDRDRGGYANTTMALSDIKYITGDNLSKVGVSQFPGAFVNLVLTEVYDKPITEPKAGTFKIIMNTTPANGGVLYFDGTLNSKGALQTTDKYDKAVDVVVEVVDGGYTLKVGDKYLEGYLNGTYKNLRLVDNAAVWTWNEEAKVFVCDIEGIKYYFGDRDRGGYANTTMALSDIKYITGDNLSKVGVSQFPGQFTNRAFVEDNQGGETPEPPVVEPPVVEPPVVEPPVEGVIDTIAELKAIATADEMTEVYTITATVTGWYNPTTAPTKYGNFYIKDATGEILVYGATSTESALVLADGKYKYTNKQDFLTNDVTKNIKIGDVVTLKVVRTNHNGTAQLNAIVVSVTAHTCDANTVLEAVEAGCETVGYTAGTACSVCGAVQSGHEEVEATGHNYVNGVCTGCGALEPTGNETTATITFDDKAKRTEYSTSKQVWVENGITVTNNKASSTSNVGDYVKPARFYKGSELIIAVEGGITKIEITVNSYDTNKYAQAIKAGVSNGTVTVSGQVVTIILDGSASSITISLAANQARVDSITVTYNG